MSRTLEQIFVANPATTNISTDLMYFSRSPYTANNDVGMLYSDFAAQFSNVLSAQGTANQVLVNGTSGTQETGNLIFTLPQDIALTSSPTFSNLKLTNGSLLDINGNTVLQLSGLPAAVNHLSIVNNFAGFTPELYAEGADTDINMTYRAKGIGRHRFISSDSLSPFIFSTGTGHQHSTFFTFADTLANQQVTWQDTSGTVAFLSDIPSGTPSALTKTDDTNVTLTLGGTPATALLQATSLTLGWTGTLSPTRGGSGVNNGSNTLTLAGSLATVGAFGSTFNFTALTNITFPTSGTLATTSQLPTPSALTKTDDTNVTITLGGTPATALLQATSLTMGWTGQLSSARGGTGVNNGTSTITIGGNFAMVGAFTFSGTITAGTAVTYPTSGTLATTAQLPTPAALTKTDDTNVTIALGGTPATALLQATSLTMGWTGQLSLTRGGTNASLVASNGGLFYSTASAGAILAGTATARQIPLSGANTAPSWSTATYPATTTINQILFSSAANTIGGIATANSATMLTSSAGVPSFTTLANGQVLIGSTGASPAAATLSAGTGISIANAANSITISSNGGDVWVDQTGTTVTMAVNTGYTSDAGASLITFTLPATSAIGDKVEINGKGSGGWKIAQAAGQQIHIGNAASTAGVGGSVASTNQFDSILLRCITANTIWVSAGAPQSAGLTIV